MSIADYSDLLIAVGEYTGRDDFTHMYPRFVSFAENKLNRRLRVGGMETYATLICAEEGYATLPTDYLEMREVKTTAGSVLESLSLPGADAKFGPHIGTPCAYVVIGNRFYPKPTPVAPPGWDEGDWDAAAWDAANTYYAWYYAKLPGLSASNTTNWLLTDLPMSYLYAVAAEVIGWAISSGRGEDAGKLQVVNGLLDDEIKSYAALDKQKRYGNIRFMVRGVTP